MLLIVEDNEAIGPINVRLFGTVPSRPQLIWRTLSVLYAMKYVRPKGLLPIYALPFGIINSYVSPALCQMMMSAAELESAIRDQINTPWKRNTLFQDSASWLMLCSCLDAIGDAELALDSYLAMEWPRDQGARYIAVYGALQLLFVQQDAVANLAEALDIPYQQNLLLKEIRDIRNDSIGHPTKRGWGHKVAYNFISRSTMRKTGFKLMTDYPDERPAAFRDVNIPDLIADQRSVLCDVLGSLLDHLTQEDMEHRERFRDHRLQDAFPRTFRYHISKVGEAIYGTRPHEVCLVDLEMVEEALGRFREQLEERGEAGAYQGVEHTVGLLDYPLAKLRAFMEGELDNQIGKEDAYIYFAFMSDRFDELREMAEEIDQSYAAPNDGDT